MHVAVHNDITLHRDRIPMGYAYCLDIDNPMLALGGRRKRRHVATTESRHTEPIAPNERARQFQTGAPHRGWVTDST